MLVVLLTLPDGIGGLIWRGRDEVLRRIARARGIEVLAFDRSSGDPDDDPPSARPPTDGPPGDGTAPSVAGPIDETRMGAGSDAEPDAEVVA